MPVPLAAGAVQLDSTYWDQQDFGSLGVRIVAGPDQRVHVAWQDDHCNVAPGGCPPNLGAPDPYPRRGMAYAYRDVSGGWHNLGRVEDPDIRNCCVTELSGGYGTLAVDPQGRAVVAQHSNEEGCDLRGDFYLQDAPNGTAWTAYLPPPADYLFPQIAALPNGGYVMIGEIPEAGTYEETVSVGASYVAQSGTRFVCYTGWQASPYATFIPSGLFPDGAAAFPSLAAASDGRAGIAIADFGANVFLIESTNGTFQAGTIRVRNLTNYSPTSISSGDSTSTQWRPFVNVHLAYQDTTPHVVWSELQARRVGGNVEFFDWRSKIRHWSSTRGVSTVYQVRAGEADRYDDLDRGLDGPIAGFNTISVDWPQVGFSPGAYGETYVIWQRHTDDQIDPTANAGLPGIITGVGFGEIVASARTWNGDWLAEPRNLTNTPQTDERFPSLARDNPRGILRLVFQASATNQAGVAVVGDRGGENCGPTGCTTPDNLVRRIAYLETSIPVDVALDQPAAAPARAALTVTPNPARGAARFAVDAGRAGPNAAVLVYSVTGRRIARLPAASGSVVWDGRDDGGRPAPPGLYLARLDTPIAGAAEGTKFLLLR